MMNCEDYKAAKHMDKVKMEKYLERIYQLGWETGAEAMYSQLKIKPPKRTLGGVSEK